MANEDDKNAGDEKAKADAARADAEKRADEKLDMVLKGIDSLRSDVESCNKRMDAWEEDKKKADAAKADAAKKDAEGDKKEGEKEDPEAEKAKELAADKARKDAGEDVQMDKKADAARADAAELANVKQELGKTQQQLLAVLARLPKEPTDAEYGELVKFQARADDIYTAFGERAPRPLNGETTIGYRRRMASQLQKHSERWKDIKFDGLDEAAFTQIEGQVYADAAERARMPNDLAPGRIRERSQTTPSGHVVTEFFGNDTHFVKQFARPYPRVNGIKIGND